MTLDKKFINYTILDLVGLYNFGIKFVFIPDHIKKVTDFFYVSTFIRMGHVIIRS